MNYLEIGEDAGSGMRGETAKPAFARMFGFVAMVVGSLFLFSFYTGL